MVWKDIWLFVHIVSVTVWVGGMLFAYQFLRPVAAQQLQPPQRLPLWSEVFARFFPWVWIAVALILASGLAMFLQVGFKRAPINWNLMFALGLTMMAIFMHVFYAPYRHLRRAVTQQNWQAAGAALNQIRRLVGINTILGFVTIALATLGRMIAS